MTVFSAHERERGSVAGLPAFTLDSRGQVPRVLDWHLAIHLSQFGFSSVMLEQVFAIAITIQMCSMSLRKLYCSLSH
jgi:hypothetical protein